MKFFAKWIVLKALFFSLIFFNVQNSFADCMGTTTVTSVSQPPAGGYVPGTVVQYCITMNNYSQAGTNWFEGIDFNLGPGWIASSLTPVTPPGNLNGGGGQWVWVNVPFVNNGITFGPGYFFDNNSNGVTSDDFGDAGTGPWSFCFSITVSGNAGASLSLSIENYSDGEAGSWGSGACDNLPGDEDPISPGTDIVLACAGGVLVSQNNISCFGQTNGSFELSANGGVAPYTFTLNGVTNSTGIFSNLSGGVHTVTITDATGCSSPFNVTITEPPLLTATNPVVVDLTCNGNLSGEISFVAGGGSPPYVYNLNFATNNNGIFTGIAAGTYICGVTDSLGCSVNFSNVVVNEPPAIVPSLTSIDSLLCFGDPDANFNISTVGGVGPYVYTSNPLALNNNGSFIVNTGGSYVVTVTDANSCTNNITVDVYQIPVPFNIVIDTIQQIRCFGDNNGKIVIIPVGGLPPYSFTCAQNPALNNSTGNFVNLLPGQYTITCKDSYGCTFIVDEVITQPVTPLSSNIISQNPVICFGDSTGSMTIQAIGGTAPYNFANSSSTIYTNPAHFPDVFAGPDTMLVVDANGCYVKLPYVMTQPTIPLTVDTLFFQSVTCLPSLDGTISLQVNGGWPISGIIYNFDLFQLQPDATFQNIISNQTGVFGNLSQGAYYVIVTDQLGCQDSSVYDITSPDFPLQGNIVVHTDNNCFDGTDGRIMFQPTGGTPPYSYTVNGQVSATNDLVNLHAGIYNILITDHNGCQFNIFETINEPPFYQLNFASIDSVKCFGECNGSVVLSVVGGTPNFTYVINGVSSNNTGIFTDLCAGPFTATVTDTLGCTQTASSSLLQPAAPLDAIEVINEPVTCNGGSDGQFYIQAIGGSPSYSYTIFGQTTLISQTNNIGVFSSLPADDYDVSIVDIYNCTTLKTVTISQPTNPLALLVSGIDPVECFGDTTGKICFNLSGGTAPYFYNCIDDVLVAEDGNLGSNNSCFWGLNAGAYTVLITDSRGCTITAPGVVTQPASPLTATSVVNDVSCFGGSNGSASVSAIGGTGVYVYAINTNQFAYNNVFIYNNLSAGTYQVIVRDENMCTFSLPILVDQPALPLASDIVNIVPLNCYGDSTACVTVAAIATTGSAPYTYNYNNVTNTTGLFCNFPAGNFSVIVTDANNCSLVQNVHVPAPPKVEASFVYGKDVSCFGGNDGVLRAAGAGGTPGISPTYFYSWVGLTVQTDSATNLFATTYCVVVKDSLGCVDTACATLTQPEKLITLTNGNSDICIGDSTVLSINATGGTPNYTFNWYPNGITQDPPLQGTPITIDPNTTTYYLVDVTDSRNCKSAKDTLNVVVHPLPTAAFVVDKPIGCEGMCVQFRDASLVSSTTNDVLANWYWYYGDNTYESAFNPNHCYNEAGSVTVRMIAETNIGCKDTVIVPNAIFVHPNPNPEFVYSPQPTTLLEPTITFSPIIIEKNLYSWDFGDGDKTNEFSPKHTYSDTGTYCVVLTQTSENGCIDSLIQCLRIDPDFTMYVPTAFTPNGDNINDNFYVIGAFLADFQIDIYDRWGSSVFAGTKLTDKWDGKLNGVELGQGTYTWYIKATDSLGKKYRKMGIVTLVR